MRLRVLIILLSSAAFSCIALLWSDWRPSGNNTLAKGAKDWSCGPRCVGAVLDRYGAENPGLLALVEEIQGPLVAKPASLESMQVAFERRGISCVPIHIGAYTTLAWNDPVIMHLEEGHFVAILESDGTNCDVWNDGTRSKEQWANLQNKSSGYLLVTSDHPLTLTEVRSACQFALGVRGLCQVVLAAALSAAVVLVVYQLVPALRFTQRWCFPNNVPERM